MPENRMIKQAEATGDSGFAGESLASLQISFLFCTVTICGFLVASEAIAHWFVIPVLCCGVLVGWDAVDWLRGRLDLFDPAGIIGVFGIHFFFLTPLLHVTWDSWLAYVEPPPDWRDWLGGMAIVNAVGLVLYRVARKRAATWSPHTATQTFWRLNRKRLFLSAGCGLVVSGALQIWVYAQYGGVIGYIEAFSQSIGDPDAAFAENMGWIFMLSESFPMLAMITFAAAAGRSRTAKSWLVIVVVLLGVFTLRMLFGGLRGSRSNTVWGLVWAVGIIHLWIRPLTKKFIFTGVIFLIVFMYFYGFYKNLGQGAFTGLQSGTTTSELSQKTGRTLDALLLGDLGRADVQAYLLYRLSRPDSEYRYAWGRTYAGTAALLVPRALWPDRPPTKVKEGTEAQFGAGSWDEHDWSSAHVYGLAGETMLNFGPIAVPVAYGIFGVIVGKLQRFFSRLRPEDMRLLMYPFICNLCLSVVQSDSDNLLFTLIKAGLVPALVVWVGSRVVTYSRAEESAIRTDVVLPKVSQSRPSD